MLLFCPHCANLLVIQEGSDCNRFACPTCPYIHSIRRKMGTKVYPKPKALDDILGSSEAWDNVATTQASCPKCNHDRAAFKQFQTRSADEPMTTFYRCCNATCAHMWREY